VNSPLKYNFIQAPSPPSFIQAPSPPCSIQAPSIQAPSPPCSDQELCDPDTLVPIDDTVNEISISGKIKHYRTVIP